MPASCPTPATEADRVVRATESVAVSTWHEGIEDLSKSDCVIHLEANGVGRVAAVLDCRPYICPVNYVMHDGAILFRTHAGSLLHMATHDSYAALEIDSVNFLYHEGWTVLVQGRSSHVTDPAEIYELSQVCVVPWAGDDRDSIVRIRIDEVRGQRIDHRCPRPHTATIWSPQRDDREEG